MSLLRCIVVLEFATAIALGQSAPSSKPSDRTGQPVAVVQNLYNEVVARHAAGIPDGADMKVFAPNLSKALLHRIDLAKACSVEWNRQNPEPDLGAQLVTSYGLFSGQGAEAEPRSFQIEKTESQKNGSVWVYVRLTWQKPSERPWTWRVAAIVLREDGHYVIDDVIYVNDSVYDNPEAKPPDRRLSEYLSAGCIGPHWAGYSLPEQPEVLARSFYQQVVARQPLGVPWGADWRALAPYMSKALLHRIAVNLACQEDWNRQNPDLNLKPPFLEDGLFTGANERAEPRSFEIERTESEKDGSFQVVVRLTWEEPPDKEIWRVAVVVVQENGRLVVDNVIFLKDKDLAVEYRLSESLTHGCKGSHWVGYGEQRSSRKPPQK